MNNINQVYIIAEIGINHEGNVEQCARMIESAAKIGVNAIKLQTINSDLNYVVNSESYKVFKSAELTRDETISVFQYAVDLGVDIFTTCGDLETARWVDELNPVAWKVSSGLLTHIPMIRSLASFGRPMIVSTGMATVDEIDTAIDVIQKTGNNNITILQCTSQYPTPMDSINLLNMSFLRKRYGYDVGFSDHSVGSDAAFLSVGVGARIIEKHFTFDASRHGFDHAISLEANEFSKMVSRIRNAEVMMGSFEKLVNSSVHETRDEVLRTIVALSSIVKGEAFTPYNLGVKRPLPGKKGADPIYLDNMIGKVSNRDFSKDEPVSIEDIK
jgi:sialic acid synthase SpsE